MTTRSFASPYVVAGGGGTGGVQTWTNQTASRALNTVYQNTDTRGMIIFVSLQIHADYTGNDATSVVQLFSDAANPPTTETAIAGYIHNQLITTGIVQDATLDLQWVLLSYIKPSDYYKATVTNVRVTTGVVITHWWELLF